MTIEVGQIYESLDPRRVRDGNPVRRLLIAGFSHGERVFEDSYPVNNPHKRRHVRILKSRLLTKAYRLVKP